MNKRISLIIILMLLVLPFSMLLNVKAVGVTITTDSNTTYAGGELVTNTGTITVYDVNTDGNGSISDTFKAYKILDIYYNSTANEMKYKFTTNFQSFLTSINNSLTVDGYFNLTSDTSGSSMGNGFIRYNVQTTSTLNVLVSQYAAYIRANNISGSLMTNTEVGGDPNKEDAQLTTAVAGSYLILPTSVTSLDNISYDNYFQTAGYTYGAMVANLIFSTNNDGEWILPEATLYAKYNDNHISGLLTNNTISNFLTMNNSQKAAVIASFASSINANVGEDVTLLIRNGLHNSISNSDNYPTNTHSSILNNATIASMLGKLTITLPAGVSIDYSELYNATSFSKLTLDTNSNILYQGQDAVGTVSNNGRTITLSSLWAMTIQLAIQNNHSFTAGSPIEIELSGYYIKDPYKDIGSNPTTEQINSVIEEINVTATIYTYGVRVNNINSSNNNLSGGVFQAYSDSNCTTGNEIGLPFTISSGEGSFVGISGNNTVYLKQITAPSGYRLIDTPIEVNPTNLTLGQDGYYEVNAVNSPMLSLPFTGGSGTVIYVVVGLLVIVCAGIFLVIYKKNNKDKKK